MKPILIWYQSVDFIWMVSPFPATDASKGMHIYVGRRRQPDILFSLWSNTLKPCQNGRHFPDDIFQCIFLNRNVQIFMKNSLKFVSKGPINNILALVQIMGWRRRGDKPLSEPMMAWFTDSYMRHLASLN